MFTAAYHGVLMLVAHPFFAEKGNPLAACVNGIARVSYVVLRLDFIMKAFLLSHLRLLHEPDFRLAYYSPIENVFLCALHCLITLPVGVAVWILVVAPISHLADRFLPK